MQWFTLGVVILVGVILLKWLTEKSAKQMEHHADRKNNHNKLRLEPSAKLSENPIPTSTYQTKRLILSPAEQNFYKILNQGLNNQFLILIKVRIADVLQPIPGISKSEWSTAFNKIKTKHFDFLLCSINSYEIIGAIELDDRSHQRTDRQRRDKFLDAACESANFPLIRISARQVYSAQEIKSAVLGSLRDYSLHKAA